MSSWCPGATTVLAKAAYIGASPAPNTNLRADTCCRWVQTLTGNVGNTKDGEAVADSGVETFGCVLGLEPEARLVREHP